MTDDAIITLWRTTSRGAVFASKAIAETFARLPELSGTQREQIAGTVYGMLSHARRIDHALSAACPRLPPKTSRALAELLAFRVIEGEISPAAAQAKLPALDWSAVAAADRALAMEPDPVRRIALSASLPDFLAERLAAEYGAEAEALAQALTSRPPMILRVNTLKTTRAEMLSAFAAAKLSAHATHLAADGIELSTRTNIFSLPQFASGEIEVQDEGSQLIAELVAPPPGGLVADYCAGAGGKTLALGALLRNKGRLLALDVNPKKLEELRRRIRRAGVANVQVLSLGSAGQWPAQLERFAGKAERVLVDVPCSGIGALRRKPEMRWRLRPEDLENLPREQEAIARQAMKLCAPGGRVIYATCTLLAAENEKVVERLLHDSEFKIVPIKEILGKARAAQIADPSGTFLKLLPHRHATDGFFAAVLRRKKN